MFAKFSHVIRTHAISSLCSQILRRMGTSYLLGHILEQLKTFFLLFLVFTLHLKEKYTYITSKNRCLDLNKLPLLSCCIRDKI